MSITLLPAPTVTASAIAPPPRGMPRSDEAEKGLLSCFLQDPGPLLNDAAAKLPHEAFYHVGNRLLYTELQSLNTRGEAIDVVTFSRHLHDRQLMDKIGGPAVLAELLNCISTPQHYRYYLTILQEKLLARRLIGLCHEAIQTTYDCEETPKEALSSLANKVIALEQEGAPKFRLMPALVSAALDRYQEAIALNGKLPGIPTGYSGLDDETGGWMKGDLIVIGGGTSDGKSAFVECLAHSAVTRGHATAIYTFEMSDDKTMDRFFCIETQIPNSHFKRGKFDQDQARKITGATTRLSRLPLYIRDVSGMKLSALLADMRLLRRQYGVELFIVDYGQLVRPDQRGHTREAEVAEMSSSLKCAAKMLNVTVIILSQLNDDGKLRESRAIGMDADIVLTLSVPDRDGIAGDKDESHRILHFGKNRDGARGAKITFQFDGPTYTFREQGAGVLASISSSPSVEPPAWKPNPYVKPKPEPQPGSAAL